MSSIKLNKSKYFSLVGIQKIALIILFFSIPFFRVSTSIPIIFLSFVTLLVLVSNQDGLRTLKTNVYFILGLFFFGASLLHSIVFFHALNMGNLQLLFLLPYIPFLIHFQSKENIKYGLYSFVGGCVVFGLTALTKASFSYSEMGFDTFFYNNLLDAFKQNPIIESMIYNLAILVTAHYYQKKGFIKNIILFIALQLFFSVMIILFGSKIGYIMLPLTLTYSAYKATHNWIQRAVLLILSLFIAYGVYLKVPYVNHEVKGTIWQWTKQEHIIPDHQLPRPIIWSNALKIINENPLKGVGLGNSVPALATEFEEIDYQKGIVGKYNAHNQFIETQLEQGIFMSILLVFIILYLFYGALKKGHWFHFFVIGLFVIYMMIEALFKSQASLLSFILFTSVFERVAHLKKNRND